MAAKKKTNKKSKFRKKTSKKKSKSGTKKTSQQSKSGLVPEGDVRLVANIRKDLHKRLKHTAVDKEITLGEILEKLIEKHIK